MTHLKMTRPTTWAALRVKIENTQVPLSRKAVVLPWVVRESALSAPFCLLTGIRLHLLPGATSPSLTQHKEAQSSTQRFESLALVLSALLYLQDGVGPASPTGLALGPLGKAWEWGTQIPETLPCGTTPGDWFTGAAKQRALYCLPARMYSPGKCHSTIWWPPCTPPPVWVWVGGMVLSEVPKPVVSHTKQTSVSV